MSTIKADTVQPKDFATDLTLGASGDTVTVAADSINTVSYTHLTLPTNREV